jgi:hypothetical protein
VQQEFPCSGTRNITKTVFMKFFAPWRALILAKRAQLDEHHVHMTELDDMIKKVNNLLKNGASPDEIDDTVKKIEQLEEKAFKTHAPDVQDKFLTAAEFEDEWLSYGGFRLRSWFKCSCGLLYTSDKAFKRLHEDIHTPTQRYYCKGWRCNQKRYRTNMGQLVAFMMSDGSIHFTYAPLPPMDIEDIRARAIELSRMPNTPQELFDSIVQYMPTADSSIIRKAVPDDFATEPVEDFWSPTEPVDGVYFITEEGQKLLSRAPMFNWHQITNMVAEQAEECAVPGA